MEKHIWLSSFKAAKKQQQQTSKEKPENAHPKQISPSSD
jgi:hypothetical protein